MRMSIVIDTNNIAAVRIDQVEAILDPFNVSLSLSPSLAPQPSVGLGLLRNLLPLKVAEFLGGFSTIFFFTG
jgi:hypothetical protein